MVERRVPANFQAAHFPLGPSQPVREWRAVEDAVRAMESPALKSVKEQLVEVLRVNYEVLDGEPDDLDG